MSQVQNFPYSTCESKKVTLLPGEYKLEVWGASGGSSTAQGGKGGYSTGSLTLYAVTDVYVHVGGQGGSYDSPGCNGGGNATNVGCKTGGGATDIRISTDSLYSRIIVAGGGGGSGDDRPEFGGFGGGLIGGNGGEDPYAGKGASQTSETVGCNSSSYTSEKECNPGTFGYGANSSGSSGGAGAGGGWFGGSASSLITASGGGSGYVLTSKSFKPTGYLLSDSIYYLKNAETIGGNESFPSPTSSAYETGHNGDGYARITSLLPLPTPMPTPMPTMVELRSELKFKFVSENFEVRDKKGVFQFYSRGRYSSSVLPGKYTFYANGSRCGQSIFTQYNINSKSTIDVALADDIIIYINNVTFLTAPGQSSSLKSFVKKDAYTVLNIHMSNYECTRTDNSSLIISYNPFYRCTQQTRKSCSKYVDLS